MFFPKAFEERLDFSSIRDELVGLCQNEIGTYLARNISFEIDRKALIVRLELLQEFLSLIQEGEDFPSFRYGHLRTHLQSIRPEGAFLSLEGIKALRELLDSVDETRSFLSSHPFDLPHLKQLNERLDPLPILQKRIKSLIDTEGEVLDTASKELYNIRQEIRRLSGSVGKTIQSLLKHAQGQGWVEKDAQPIIRDGKLLLPIIPSAKRDVKGIIHDDSATGRTLFVEPEQLVETNNKIREKQGEEKREIIRLLKEITALLRPNIPAIQDNSEVIGALDFTHAKAKLAIRMRAIVPEMNNAPSFEWIQARHPLLENHLRKQDKEIVPLDITLSTSDRILVISGPNAGGKSVVLKTVGLLQYMLQCGMAIPVKEGSQCCTFEKIFLDIGDDQSLENDLSTYSSHLMNMKYFCQHANARTLLLIDEFGSGTEPIIGGAIAEALLNDFLRIGCFGLITTHYGNLKDFCETHKGAINGAMLFDRQKIQPLFQLYIGKPGSSFAIEIAQKRGLPPSIIKYATELVGEDYVLQDKYLQDIMRDKKYWAEKRRKVKEREKELEKLHEKLKGRLEKVNTQQREIIEKAEKEALQIISGANASIEKAIRTIKESKANKEETLKARELLEEKKKSLTSKKKTKPVLQNKRSGSTKQEIRIGSFVSIDGSRESGEVVEILNGQKVKVRLGSLMMTLPIEKLSPTSRAPISIQKSRPTVVENQHDTRRLNFSSQLDCRGMRVDEALQQVVHFLDDASQYRFSPVRILHGTGTGALREAIRQQLSASPLVASFRDELLDLGGAGITVVSLDL